MSNQNNSKENLETTGNGEVPTSNTSTQHYYEGTIVHNINVDKYTKEPKESFSIEAKEIAAKFRVKKDSLLELAILNEKHTEFSLLLNNGYEASGTMSAGAGKAVKFNKLTDWYECIFFESELGKEFNPKKIQSKTFIKLKSEHLGAIFTFLRLNDEVKKAKAEELKIQRTTLEL